MSKGNPEKIISRFRKALFDWNICQGEIDGLCPTGYPLRSADAKNFRLLMDWKAPALQADGRRSPNKTFQDRGVAVQEMRQAAPELLSLFREFNCDATPVFKFLRDANILRRFGNWPALEIESAIDNLELHATGEIKLPEASRTMPMSKVDMQVLLGNPPRRKFEKMIAPHDLRPYDGNRQYWTLSLEKMDSTMRQKFAISK